MAKAVSGPYLLMVKKLPKAALENHNLVYFRWMTWLM